MSKPLETEAITAEVVESGVDVILGGDDYLPVRLAFFLAKRYPHRRAQPD